MIIVYLFIYSFSTRIALFARYVNMNLNQTRERGKLMKKKLVRYPLYLAATFLFLHIGMPMEVVATENYPEEMPPIEESTFSALETQESDEKDSDNNEETPNIGTQMGADESSSEDSNNQSTNFNIMARAKIDSRESADTEIDYGLNHVRARSVSTSAVEVEGLNSQAEKRVNPTASEFLDAVAPHAVRVAKKYNLYPSVMMAQAALESGYGKSKLSKAPNYNLFGIKGSYQGQSVVMPTKEYIKGKWISVDARFQKYPSYGPSFESNALTIRRGPDFDRNYYWGAWRENARNYQDVTKWLTGRYATDPNYNTKLNRIIENHFLTRFDEMAYRPTLVAQPTYEVDRLQGENRYASAVAMSQQMYHSNQHVVLTTGEKTVDAITGTPLAAQYNAPLLLTRKNSLSPETRAEIIRLQAQKVTVLGGHLAVSDHIVSQLQDLGLQVRRIGGKNRYHQAALVAQEVIENNGGRVDAVFITNGNDNRLADSISSAVYAAKNQIPILLVNYSRMDESTERIVSQANKVYLIGGEVAIGQDLQNRIQASGKSAERLAGRNRYETNRIIVKKFMPHIRHYYVVSGESFTDALPASVLAHKKGSGILLVKNGNLWNLREQINFAKYYTNHFTLIGGPFALSPRTEIGIMYAHHRLV